MLGASVATPVATEVAGRGVVVLAGQRLPGQSLGLVAAQLEHMRAPGVDRDAAVEAVATEVGEVAPAANVGLERVEQCAARVFGMGTGDHGPSTGERRRPFAVQIVIGEQVGADPAALEEAEQDQILGEPVRSGVLGAAIAGAQLGQRPEQRRLVDADAVGMAVIEAEQSVLGHPAILGAVRAGERRARALTRIGEVGEARQQDRRRRRRGAATAADHERDHVLAAAGGDQRRIDAARALGRDLELERCLPAEVVDAVGVEVHRLVLLLAETPIVDLAGPVVTR